jgi:hypothetical protein
MRVNHRRRHDAAGILLSSSRLIEETWKIPKFSGISIVPRFTYRDGQILADTIELSSTNYATLCRFN